MRPIPTRSGAFGLLGRLALILAVLTACQSPGRVAEKFRDATEDGSGYHPSESTAIVFLVDGLSSSVLRDAVRGGRVPHLSRYFRIQARGGFRLGRASFPSLTYPNLVSLLTGRTVAEHPVIGNRIVTDAGSADFENVLDWKLLDSLLEGRTVFDRLSVSGETSVSFSYPFRKGTTAHLRRNIDAGISYLERDFAEIDTSTLVSLRLFLERTPPRAWPRFVFVHLIGLDSTIHEAGPGDDRVQGYLRDLDARMAGIFATLERAAAGGRRLQVALTSDHGFVKTEFRIPVERAIAKLDRGIRLVSDNRIASLRLPASLSILERQELAEGLLQIPHVAWTAVKMPDRIELRHASGRLAHLELMSAECRTGEWAARFRWLNRDEAVTTSSRLPFFCLETYDRAGGPDNDSYIVPAMAEYFSGPNAPDLVLIPDERSDFSGAYRGNHGGLTREEILVPLLTRDVALPPGTPPTSRLLKTMGLPD